MKLVVALVVPFFMAWLGAAHDAQAARRCFDAATVQLDANDPPFRRMLDFDGDGDLDAIGAALFRDRSHYQISAYRNSGRGVFGEVWNDAEWTAHLAGDLLIEVGNLNLDVWPDVCILVGGQRHDWLGQGDGSFVEQQRQPYGTSARGLVLADLDQDGRDDVAWIDDDDLHVDTAGLDGEIALGAGFKHGLRVLPQDGPAGTDIFLVSAGDDVRFYYGSSTLGLVAGPVLTHGLTAPMLDTGDLDGDGDLDAVVFGGGDTPRFCVLRRTAPGAWTLELATVGGPAEFLDDVDGDGDLDGTCCGGGGGSALPDNIQPTDFQICINDGTGRFGNAFKIPGVGSPQLAGTVDVDGDGDADLVAGRCVYFAAGPIRPLRSALAPPPVRGLRDAADYDGDGDWDVGFSIDGAFENDGAGNFLLTTPALVPPPSGARYLGPGFPGDFDVDLLVELVSLSRTVALGGQGHARNQFSVMALLQNDGAGAMPQATLASGPGVTFAVDGREVEDSLVVDVDLDGDLDLLTRTREPLGATRLWANDGAGFFHGGGTFPERASWAGDVDLDGDLDLITSGSATSAKTYLYLGANPARGRFPVLVRDLRMPGWDFDPAKGFSTGDFNQDGYPDFAVAPPIIFDVLAFNNRFPLGDSLRVDFALDSSNNLDPAARVELGDLNGDGLLDALTGTLSGELTEISEVHRKLAPGPATTGMFETAVQLLPIGLLLDLDQDGDLDILGSRIAFNRTLP